MNMFVDWLHVSMFPVATSATFPRGDLIILDSQTVKRLEW